MEQVLEKELLHDESASWAALQDDHLQKDAERNIKIAQTLNLAQKDRVVVPRPDEVRSYLQNYPDIIDIIPSLCKKARKEFVLPTQLSLELYRDPEIEYEYLTLYVRQQNYATDILDKIDAISAEFDQAIAGKAGWLIMATDLCSPQ